MRRVMGDHSGVIGWRSHGDVRLLYWLDYLLCTCRHFRLLQVHEFTRSRGYIVDHFWYLWTEDGYNLIQWRGRFACFSWIDYGHQFLYIRYLFHEGIFAV